MSTDRAIAAEYCDLKFIKGRKVAQIIMEIPIEKASEFVEKFGTPLPDRSVPVAIARLNEVGAKRVSTRLAGGPPPERAPRHDGEHSTLVPQEPALLRPLSQQCAMTCLGARFHRFLEETRSHHIGKTAQVDEEGAADYVRWWCGVESRSELDRNELAACKWKELYHEYQAWLRAAA